MLFDSFERDNFKQRTQIFFISRNSVCRGQYSGIHNTVDKEDNSSIDFR